MQPIVDSCGCHASKQSGSRDQGVVASLPMPYCADSLLYVGFIQGLPKVGGYDSCLVVTCGLDPFYPCTSLQQKDHSRSDCEIFGEEWFKHYGAPKEVHSDEDVRIRSDTGWCKRILDALNVHVTTGVPYTQSSPPP